MKNLQGFDVSGTWRRDDNLIIKLFYQENGELWSEPFALSPEFGHILYGTYDPRRLGSYTFTVERTDNRPGRNQCLTEMYGKLVKIDEGSLKWIIEGTDNKCDLAPDYGEEFTLVKIKEQ